MWPSTPCTRTLPVEILRMRGDNITCDMHLYNRALFSIHGHDLARCCYRQAAHRRRLLDGLFASHTTEDTAEADLRYVNMERLKTYDKFIVNPVVVQFYEKSKAQQKLSQEDIATVTVYLRSKVVEALSQGGYAVVSQPGPGVALLRVALTDIVTSKWYLNVLPQTRLLGPGMGGAAVGAVGGAIAGDAKKGAAIGAASGGLIGGMRRRRR